MIQVSCRLDEQSTHTLALATPLDEAAHLNDGSAVHPQHPDPFMRGVLALRFDVDSVTCIERGIPELRRLADRLGVRFTFFLNMGYSFNWSHHLRHLLRSWGGRGSKQKGRSHRRLSLPTTVKLGWGGVLKTVLLNPCLGERYRATFDALHADGHELGLHGGTDHVIWQRSLDDLEEEGLEELFRPAFERFSERYGRPAGFASPGFRFNDAVSRLLAAEGFTYTSDVVGETPYEQMAPDGVPYGHFQVPVNVLGDEMVPLVEQGLAQGRPTADIEQDLVDAITARDFALAYGHPYVEGVRASLLGRVLERVRDTHDVVTVADYLHRWQGQLG